MDGNVTWGKLNYRMCSMISTICVHFSHILPLEQTEETRSEHFLVTIITTINKYFRVRATDDEIQSSTKMIS
jgi:hypothetical protein